MTERVTDKKLLAWLAAGATTRGVGGGLTFSCTARGAAQGQASWILRYRIAGLQRELTLGRYPDLSLKAARDLARQKRVLIQQGVDVAVQKQVERLALLEQHDVSGLAQAWYERYIANRLKHPGVVERVIRNYIRPTIGKLPIAEVRPAHVDLVLTRIVAAGAPTVANDALRYLFRMFHFAAKRRWIEGNPVAGFEVSDAGGTESPRERWLPREELAALLAAMPATASFGRQNELAVLLLLALCVRKMELLGAKWDAFDLERGVWSLHLSRTKTKQTIKIPLCPAVITWLHEVKVFAAGSPYLFPARLQIRVRKGVARKNRFGHVSPDTLNIALKRLPMSGIEHFTVHDMRRTARTHLAGMGVDWRIAERALNHKLSDTQGVYDLHDYFSERRMALSKWTEVLVDPGEPQTNPSSVTASSAQHHGAPRESFSPNTMGVASPCTPGLPGGCSRSAEGNRPIISVVRPRSGKTDSKRVQTCGPQPDNHAEASALPSPREARHATS